MSSARKIVIGLLLLAGVTGGYAFWQKEASPNDVAVRACHEEIKERISTPSSFREVNTTIFDSAIGADEYYRHLGTTAAERRQRRVELLVALGSSQEDAARQADREVVASPVRRTIRVSFDASNMFGAIMRQEFICDYMLRSSRDDINEMQIRSRTIARHLDRGRYTEQMARDAIEALQRARPQEIVPGR